MVHYVALLLTNPLLVSSPFIVAKTFYRHNHIYTHIHTHTHTQYATECLLRGILAPRINPVCPLRVNLAVRSGSPERSSSRSGRRLKRLVCLLRKLMLINCCRRTTRIANTTRAMLWVNSLCQASRLQPMRGTSSWNASETFSLCRIKVSNLHWFWFYC